MNTNHRSVVIAAGFGIWTLAGCGATAEGLDDVGEATQRIATPVDIAHACQHAQNPPGGSYVSMSPSSSASTSSPLASEHVAYDFTLPGSGTSFSGWTRFTADETAEFGVYTDPASSVNVYNVKTDGTVGTEVSKAWDKNLTAADCAGSSNPSLPTFGTSQALSKVRTYNLQNGKTYYVKVGNSSNHALGLLENLNEQ